MAVVTTNLSITGQLADQWTVPTGDVLALTPVPRGLLLHQGATSYAAKLAADETRLNVTLSFNSSFCYLLKSISVAISSQDKVMDFDLQGWGQYAITNTDPAVEMVSQGTSHFGATLTAWNLYQPSPHAVRRIVDGAVDGSFSMGFSDISADASTAGTIFLYADWWVYDTDQCRNWPIHSPMPVIAN